MQTVVYYRKIGTGHFDDRNLTLETTNKCYLMTIAGSASLAGTLRYH
jgi:hypothetical protein